MTLVQDRRASIFLTDVKSHGKEEGRGRLSSVVEDSCLADWTTMAMLHWA
jgi:hypothetical protein